MKEGDEYTAASNIMAEYFFLGIWSKNVEKLMQLLFLFFLDVNNTFFFLCLEKQQKKHAHRKI